MNHINSIRRPGLENKTPYELAEADADMQALMRLLKMHPIGTSATVAALIPVNAVLKSSKATSGLT